jgi:hypothetical protein
LQVLLPRDKEWDLERFKVFLIRLPVGKVGKDGGEWCEACYERTILTPYSGCRASTNPQKKKRKKLLMLHCPTAEVRAWKRDKKTDRQRERVCVKRNREKGKKFCHA